MNVIQSYQMDKKREKHISYIILALIIIAVVFFVNPRKVKEEYLEMPPVHKIEEGALPVESRAEEKQVLPSSFVLNVPFQSQAPNRNWAQPYQDACEEASIAMVKYFYEGKVITTEQMKSEIDQSVAWQVQNYGGHLDLNAVGTLKLAEEYFSLNGEVVVDYSLDSIKRLIFAGTPVLAPTAGRVLANPGYTAPGPVYHMIVLIGYDDSRGVFITNDPGVNHGANFEFKYQTVLDAISGPKQDMVKELIILTKP